MYAALLDTCVLWPSLQRDFLLSLAVEGLYRPLWSDAILEELEEHEEHEALKLKKYGAPQGESKQKAFSLTQQMRTAFPDAEIRGWEPLEGTYGLPDPDDEHVVAAAHFAGAGAIVTANFKDFPSKLIPASIEVISAQDFALNTVALSPAGALTALGHISARYGRNGPARSVEDLLAVLKERYAMHDAVDLLISNRK
jgi:predicted nucleic acid-binding protein